MEPASSQVSLSGKSKQVKSSQSKQVKPTYRIVKAKPEHGYGIYEVICIANMFDPDAHISGVFGLKEWQTLLVRFAEGQLIAVADVNGQEKVVGVALSLRTSYEPTEQPLPWYKVIGDLALANHDAGGRWLYGVEKAVHPDFQGTGIGTALYKAQFDLVKRLELKGIYAGGMLKGFQHHKHDMSMSEYAARVMRGELFDPTVSVQMRRGFKPVQIIENYAWDAQADHTGMLIVWEAPKKTGQPVKSHLQTASL